MKPSDVDADLASDGSSCPSCGAALTPGAVCDGLCVWCLLNPEAVNLSTDDAPRETEAPSASESGGLHVGVTLGPYEIVSRLGSGGMGHVYQAWDTRLCRHVAIKVLPGPFSADPRRIRRLEREARIVAGLNHPHICAVHDIGHENGLPYIVMEHLEGETLADRLAQGPLPVDDVLDVGIQIADGLDRAHRQGITHRDLKPGNIMLTASGAKLLDFGLAGLGGGKDTHELPAGVVAGTVQYMAPEQLEGKPADVRSDVFAFGLVLHEMAEAGAGSTRPSALPHGLERIVARCLRKDPEERWQSVRDVLFELTSLREEHTQPARPSVFGASRTTRRRVSIALGVTAVTASVIAGFTIFPEAARRPPKSPAVRFVAAPPSVAGSPGSGSLAFVSPDGLRLVWVVPMGDGKTALAVQSLDSAEPTVLEGTDEARWPFWSADSRTLAFFARGQLKKVSSSGGLVETIAKAPWGRGGSWSRDGIIAFAPDRTGPLYQIPETGGTPRALTATDQSRGEVSHQWPTFLPDGRHFVYFASSDRAEYRGLYVGAIGSSERRWLGAADGGTAYASPGYLLFTRAAMLLAQPFDAKQLQLLGKPLMVHPHVYPPANFGPPGFSLSNTGVLVYNVARLFRHQLAWFSRSGRQVDVPLEPGSYSSPVLSPDGSRVALERHDPDSWEVGVWQLDLARHVFSRVSDEPRMSMGPLWSADGKSIVFSSRRNSDYSVYRIGARGGTAQILLKESQKVLPTDWSPDQRFLLYQMRDEDTKDDIWVLPLDHGPPFPYARSRFNERQARFSPNGRWIAYSSDESGRSEVYVQSFPASGAKWQISNDGGHEPTWRGDGRELFYVTGDRRLMSVPVQISGRFGVGVGSALFRIPSDAYPEERISYAPAADGQRFLVSVAAPDRVRLPPLETDVIVNWPSLVHP